MKTRRIVVVIFGVLLISIQALVAAGYGFFDYTQRSDDLVITTGDWIYTKMSTEFAEQVQVYMDQQLALDPYSNLQYVYSQTGFANKTRSEIPSILAFGYDWDFESVGLTVNQEIYGYPVLIDRTTDTNGNPIHDLVPDYSETPLYDDYSYFIANDIINTNTNSLYSLRLNGYTIMTLSEPIIGITTLSFEAKMGLADSDEPGIRKAARLYIQYSTDGVNFTTLANVKPSSSTKTSASFSEYSFTIPTNYQSQPLYLRIYCVGKTNKKLKPSRIVIDNLIITTE